MSSFRSTIIKSSASPREVVADFRFTRLRSDADAPPAEVRQFGPGQFVPLQLEESRPVEDCPSGQAAFGQESELLHETPVPPEPPGISLEELEAKVQEAYRQGLVDGRQEAVQAVEGQLRTVDDAAHEITSLRRKVLRESELELLKLSCQVAKRIIRKELSLDRQILATFIGEALENISDRDEVVVRLNPDDYRVVNSHRQLYLAGVGGEQNLTIKSDDTVTPGGCIVDTDLGVVDARVETQLDELYRRLFEVHGERLDPMPLSSSGEEYVFA